MKHAYVHAAEYQSRLARFADSSTTMPLAMDADFPALSMHPMEGVDLNAALIPQ